MGVGIQRLQVPSDPPTWCISRSVRDHRASKHLLSDPDPIQRKLFTTCQLRGHRPIDWECECECVDQELVVCRTQGLQLCKMFIRVVDAKESSACLSVRKGPLSCRRHMSPLVVFLTRLGNVALVFCEELSGHFPKQRPYCSAG